jgi:phosphohistidine phosphatase
MGGVRTLLLLRHAKSSWADPELADIDRPLAARGVRAARRMAAHLEATGPQPDVVLCSSARRARQTLELLRPALGDRSDVQVDGRLYGADATAILGRVRALDVGVGSVMVVGHNPGIQDLALELAGVGDGDALAQLRVKFPTGALATLQLRDGTWSQLGPGGAFLAALTLPRQLSDARQL